MAHQLELLKLLHHSGDPDMRWVIDKVRSEGGAADLRRVYDIAGHTIPGTTLSPLDTLALGSHIRLTVLEAS